MSEPTRAGDLVAINGESYEREVEARKLLVHFLRDDLDLTGTHIGCDTGNCGACSVILDGQAVKSCMMLAVQADGPAVDTVEGLGRGRRAEPAPEGVQRGARAPVRLLHAGDADERDVPARAATRSERGRDEEGDPGQHLPLHGLPQHRQGDPARRQGGAR